MEEAELAYLPPVVCLVLLLLCVVCVSVHWLSRTQSASVSQPSSTFNHVQCRNLLLARASGAHPSLIKLACDTASSSTYMCCVCTNYPTTAECLLCVYRGALFIAFANTLIHLHDPDEWEYLTIWNLALIICYFLSSCILSCNGILRSILAILPADLVHDVSDRTVWTILVQWLGSLSQVMFEVCGASALFISTVNFLLIDSSLTPLNLELHVFTTAALLIEATLNCYIVRWEHILVYLAWNSAYLACTWYRAITSPSSEWPYPFLSTSQPSALLWYASLYALACVFYGLWYAIFRIKMSLLCYIWREMPAFPFVEDCGDPLLAPQVVEA